MNYNFAVIDWELLNQPFLPLFCAFALYQGMGGQHGYFGLWLDSDFGKGHSRARPKCTTYGSPQLSGEEDFTLDSMEVWAVGKPPKPEEVRQHLLFTRQHKVTKCCAKWTPTAFKLGTIRVCTLKIWEFILQMSSKTFAALSTVTQMENFIYIAASLLHCHFL